MTLTSQTLAATETALLASARRTRVEQSFVAVEGTTTLLIDCFRAPTTPEADPGWLCPSTVGALLRVVFHVDPTRRAVYLKIDRAAAPLTGNYVVRINALAAVTYNATASAPADVDALLAGIVAAIAGNAPMAAVVTADVYAMTAGGDNDAIRLRAVTTGVYATFLLHSDTAFPAGAALSCSGEVNFACARIHMRPASDIVASAVANAPIRSMLTAWTLVHDYSDGGDVPLDPVGIAEQINVATGSAIWVELYDEDVPLDTETVIPLAACYIAPALADIATP